MKKERVLDIIEIVLFFTAFYLPGYLAQNAQVDPSIFNNPVFHFTYITSALPQIALLLFILFLRRKNEKTFSEVLHRFGINPPRLSLLWKTAAAVGGLLVLAFLGGFLHLLPPVGENEAFQPIRWELSRLALIPLVLITSLVTGYREEMFFRSYLITRFEGLSVPIAGRLLLPSVLFALGHVYQGITAAVITFCIGFYLSVLFLKFKDLHMLAIGHGLYNFLSLILLQPYDNFFIY